MRTAAIVMLAAIGLALTACAPPPPKEYAYPAWNFAASFRGPPKVTETKASADGSTPHSLLVESNVGGDDFAVNVTDASAATSTADQMLDATPQALAKSMGVDVGATVYAATGQVTGREVRFDKGGEPVMLMRVFVAGNFLYEVSANSAKGVTDPNVRVFLDSFHLLSAPPAAPVPAANATNSSGATDSGNAAVAQATNAGQ